MALTKCEECGHDVSTKADKCPHCGAPRRPEPVAARLAQPPVRPAIRMMAWSVLGLLAVIWVVAMFTGPSHEEVAAANAARDGQCRKDLQCAGDKYIAAASVYCKDPIERSARHAVRWTDAALETKFGRFRWVDQPGGAITFIGDKVEFQNGFGAFTPMIYQCDMVPETHQVLDVRVSEGRLPV